MLLTFTIASTTTYLYAKYITRNIAAAYAIILKLTTEQALLRIRRLNGTFGGKISIYADVYVILENILQKF